MNAVHSPWLTVYDSTSSQALAITERVITIDNAIYTLINGADVHIHMKYEAQENKLSQLDSLLKIQSYRLLSQNYYFTQR